MRSVLEVKGTRQQSSNKGDRSNEGHLHFQVIYSRYWKGLLQIINGIGVAMSSRIIAQRQKATFEDEDDLVSRVTGISSNFVARIKQTHS